MPLKLVIQCTLLHYINISINVIIHIPGLLRQIELIVSLRKFQRWLLCLLLLPSANSRNGYTSVVQHNYIFILYYILYID